jgi:hypothetical protein
MKKYLIILVLLIPSLAFASYAGTKIKSAYKTIINKTNPYVLVDSSLVGWWTMDGADVVNGVALDKSGNNNNGNLISIATTTFYKPGKIGQAFNFDGVNDAVSFGNIPNTANVSNLTVASWIKFNRLGVLEVPFSKQHYSAGFTDWALSKYSNNLLRWGVMNTSFAYVEAPPYTLADLKWHYYVGTYDGAKVRFYVDGVQIGNGNDQTGNIVNRVDFVCLGVAAGGVGSCASSQMVPAQMSADDVRIYNRALSATEVLQLYNAGSVTIKKSL